MTITEGVFDSSQLPVAPIDDGKRAVSAEDQSSDLPPSYSQVASSPEPIGRRPRATNYLYISEQYNSLKGSYAIDPSMSIPVSVLPKLEDGETEMDRRNLRLRAEHGSVTAAILLLPPQGDESDDVKRNRTLLEASSEHGTVNIRVRTADAVPPFHLKVRSPHGSLTVEIPRSFHGFLRLKKEHSSIKLSDELASESTQLSVVDGVSMWFVGDFSLFKGEWEGDEVEADTTHGRITVRYADEQAGASRPGFFGRLLGL
ncbi:hypothetical protein CONPUDRAFT_146325 [Coniophora puteana RWD-64-598 SS2]|uniref:DUF7330 domain-containing protein n=1 Tax=Coniophora puteana (strain RWD-64-598) TaxID=741705 RepID=A0A5M3MEX3_CONPW|nr:uncharacterized protein CONPUDRAFT_146325 [Coniophora puteana RWD-64-598 SS2]EIW77344.1 hypothetical protein CONPUDRAFT_146325 [Coniophora puteana RWD-64-598 SS2]